ncbi:MAG: hypothetical protein JNK82_12865 [Myxococcaceae bacterium]|nr:hypothetical protein [Myxococcaceae bacterium]
MTRLGLGVLAVMVASCDCANPATHNGTALFVIVELGAVSPDQLSFSVSGEANIFLRPVGPAGPLPDPQTVRLLLADGRAGQTVTVGVKAFRQSEPVGSGEASAMVVLGFETEVRVRLMGPKPDAGTCGPENCNGCCAGDACIAGDQPGACGRGGNVCQACASNDRCTGGACEGCNANNCAGCCRGSLCITEQNAFVCGAAGEACRACPPLRAECSPSGECGCGAGGVCGLGQRCKEGVCVCDGVSCSDGCCQGNECRKADRDRCGFAGSSCTACDQRADSCSNGRCACGSGPACGPEQLCHDGECRCNATSCPGCCDGNICRSPSGQYCGPRGGNCSTCDSRFSDSCDPQLGCTCGNAGRRCINDERCIQGVCKCGPESCPDGCCSGDQCIRMSSTTTCGGAGNQCSVCPGMSACTDGICAGSACMACNGCCANGASCDETPEFPTCSIATGAACQQCDVRSDRCGPTGCACGDGGPCGQGQYCSDAGTCACGPESCGTCCQANGSCAPNGNLLNRCGAGGAACANCPALRANRCELGDCKCGAGPACAIGERCDADAGKCACDTTLCSVTGGCCSGTSCIARDAGTLMACGTAGACQVCDASKANQCVFGMCMCGGGAACGTGEACVGGVCVCNLGTGCPGCCQNGTTCVLATNDGVCGSGGASCRGCPGAQRCSGGQCCLLDVLGLVCIGSGG